MATRGLEAVTGIAAALSRAAASALDPASVLARTTAVLAAELPLAETHLWRAGPDGPTLLASHRVPGSPDPAAAGAPPGAPTAATPFAYPVESRGQLLGHLVVEPATGAALDGDDAALLALAASLVGGALERLDLFREVMALERMKSDFLARVSHELRTPITIINGFLETMLAHDEALEPDRRRHMLERSRVAAGRLGHLIEELLVLSRIEGGVLTPRPTAVELAGVVDEVQRTASEPEQVLVVGEVTGSLTTDRSLLVQALSLVVDNAIKYGGVAELSAHRDGDRWTLEVRDRGPGFGDDARGTAFEMFARSQQVSTVPGLGAGLAIARTIVEVLDGSIALDDARPGPGAVVTIALPAR